MNRVKQLGMGLMMLSLAGLVSACAVVKPEVRAVVRETGMAKQGDTVHLYYAMSKKTLEEFCPDAVVPVYRISEGYSGTTKSEVGKIKVIEAESPRYIKAVVVEGTMRSGDIAMQSNTECILQLPETPLVDQ